MTVNKGKSSLVLYAFYDLQICTVTFDFLSFLLRAEMRRIQVGCKSLHIVFVPGADDGFRMMHLSGDISRWRLQNMHIAACSFLSSIKGITVCSKRAQATSIEDNLASNIFPVDYTTHIFDSQKAIQSSIDAFMFAGVVIRHLKGDEVPVLTPTLRAQQYVREWYEKHAKGRKVIAITLRESPNDPARNSNLDAWARFAATIDENEFLPVIIRDTDAVFSTVPDKIKGLCHFNEAAIDLDLRLAFYEFAFLNMLVNNGPLQVCYLNPKIRYLAYKMFNVTNEADERATCGVYGIPIGGQLPMATPFQRVIWDDDNYEVLIESFLETSHAINDASGRNELEKMEIRPSPGRDGSFRFAVTLHEVSWFEHALDIYDHLLTLYPDDIEVSVMRGLALLHLGQLEKSKVVLKSCLERQPDFKQCSFNLALAEFLLGNTSASIKILESLKVNSVKMHGILGCLGEFYSSEKSFEKAADAFSADLESNPFKWKTWFDLAACQTKLGKSKEALNSYLNGINCHKKLERDLKQAELVLFPWKKTLLEGRHTHQILPGIGSTLMMDEQQKFDTKNFSQAEGELLIIYDLGSISNGDDFDAVYEGFKQTVGSASGSANHICVVPQENEQSGAEKKLAMMHLIARWIPTICNNKGMSLFADRNEALQFLAVQKTMYNRSNKDDSKTNDVINTSVLDKKLSSLSSTSQAKAYIINWKSAHCEGSKLFVVVLSRRNFETLNGEQSHSNKLKTIIKENRNAGVETLLVVPSESTFLFSVKEAEKYGVYFPACVHYDLRYALFEAADKVCTLGVEVSLPQDTVREMGGFDELFRELVNSDNKAEILSLSANDSEIKIDDAFKMGVQLYCGGAATFNKGVHIFQRILQVSPRHANSIGMLGIAANMFRKHQDAIELLQKAIALNDCEPAFHFNLGNAFFEEGHYQEAMYAYRDAAKNCQTLYEPWDCLGDTYTKLGESEAAISAYEQAISLGAQHPDTFAQLAKCYEEIGNIGMALKFFQAAGDILRKKDDKEQACITMIWPWRPKLIRPENGALIDFCSD